MIKPVEINITFDEGFKNCVPKIWLKTIARKALASEGQADVETGILITGEAQIQELNQQYLKEDHPTDVLSFAMQESAAGEVVNFPISPDKLQHLGEVIISYPQAKKQAREHKHPVKKEMAVLLIHGILHLLGYDHDVPEREQTMKQREQAIFNLVSEDLN